MEDFGLITVTRKNGSNHLTIKNPTSYQLIGQGKQGAVFQLSPSKCVKIFANPKQAKKECSIAKKLDGLPFMPMIYETGENYLVMEYVNGVPLDEYLKKQGELTESITEQILCLVKEMRQFNKTNVEVKHVLVTDDGVLKKIDHGSRKPYKGQTDRPHKIIKMLQDTNLADKFWKHLKEMDPEAYRNWK